METNDVVLAFDFGGTKLAAALIDLQAGEIVAVNRRSTPAAEGSEACLLAMFGLGEALMDAHRRKPGSIGISYGGPVTPDRERCVLSNHVPGWDLFPLVERTKAQFGLPTFMDNDANAAALGSWAFDVMKRPDDFMYIQASTGIGSGLVLDRRLYRGSSMAGEIGHTKVVWNRADCVCGNVGCLETICAGWGIAARAAEVLGKGLHPTAEEVFAAMRAGDEPLRKMIEAAFTAFGVNVASAVAVLDLQQVMFGGGIFRSRDIIEPIMMAAIDDATPSYMRGRCHYGFSGLNGTETLLGAAMLTQEVG